MLIHLSKIFSYLEETEDAFWILILSEARRHEFMSALTPVSVQLHWGLNIYIISVIFGIFHRLIEWFGLEGTL